jgi:hypothetical protein
LGFIARVATDTFVENVPVESIKNYPRKSLLIFGIISYSVILALWVYFFVVGYEASVRQTFISFDRSSGICQQVAQPITGVFLASRDAKWEGKFLRLFRLIEQSKRDS